MISFDFYDHRFYFSFVFMTLINSGSGTQAHIIHCDLLIYVYVVLNSEHSIHCTLYTHVQQVQSKALDIVQPFLHTWWSLTQLQFHWFDCTSNGKKNRLFRIVRYQSVFTLFFYRFPQKMMGNANKTIEQTKIKSSSISSNGICLSLHSSHTWILCVTNGSIAIQFIAI